MENLQPDSKFVVTDLETLKIVSNPLRIQIVESMLPEPLTVSQVAERLGVAPSKLYYHVNLLEEHGLIKVVQERVVSNIIEKVYRAVAEELEVDPSLLSFSTKEGQDNVRTMLAATIDATREDVVRSLDAGAFELEQGVERHPGRAILHRTKSRIGEDKIAEFKDRLRDLLQEFEAADTEGDQSEDSKASAAYALTVVFYPSLYFPDSEESE